MLVEVDEGLDELEELDDPYSKWRTSAGVG